MRFIRQDVVSEVEAKAVGPFDIAFHGDPDMDDRSRHSVELARAASRRQCQVKYDSQNFQLHVDGKPMRVDQLEDVIRQFQAKSILLDATTLEFPDILYILTAYCMQKPRPRCGFFYVEPQGYRKRNTANSVVPGNVFDLTTGFEPRQPLPRYKRILTGKVHLVAFLGFEGDRLMRVLNEDDGYVFHKISVVFGIPPFQPDWDLHALMANSTLLDRNNMHVAYCGANNPRSAYKLLEDAHRALTTSQTSRLAVAPFGTKPMALGTALYLVDNDVYSPIFDHPVRKRDRTYGVHRRHWYEVDLNP